MECGKCIFISAFSLIGAGDPNFCTAFQKPMKEGCPKAPSLLSDRWGKWAVICSLCGEELRGKTKAELAKAFRRHACVRDVV